MSLKCKSHGINLPQTTGIFVCKQTDGHFILCLYAITLSEKQLSIQGHSFHTSTWTNSSYSTLTDVWNHNCWLIHTKAWLEWWFCSSQCPCKPQWRSCETICNLTRTIISTECNISGFTHELFQFWQTKWLPSLWLVPREHGSWNQTFTPRQGGFAKVWASLCSECRQTESWTEQNRRITSIIKSTQQKAGELWALPWCWRTTGRSHAAWPRRWSTEGPDPQKQTNQSMSRL